MHQPPFGVGVLLRLLPVVPLLAACGGGTASPPPGVEPPGQSLAVVPGTPAALRIDAADSPLRGFSLELAGDEIEGPATLRASESARPRLPPWGRPLGPTVELAPHGTGFTRPVTVRLPFPSAALGQRPSGHATIGMLRSVLPDTEPLLEWVATLALGHDGSVALAGPAFPDEGPVAVEPNPGNPAGNDLRLVFRLQGFSRWTLFVAPTGPLQPNQPWPYEMPLVQVLPLDCAGTVDCYDHDNCTYEACIDGRCHWVDVPEGSACSSGNPYIEDETCQAGRCTGTEIECLVDADCVLEDSCYETRCVQRRCEYVGPKPAGTACRDPWNNPCLVDNRCVGAVCVGSPRDCDDGNPCTLDTCDYHLGGCQQYRLGPTTTCEDGDDDTVQDRCQDGICRGDLRECQGDPDCTGRGPCHAGTCAGGLCRYTATSGAPCDDGDPDSTGDTCVKGFCQGTWNECTRAEDCDDRNPCTRDSCVQGACVHRDEKIGTPCSTDPCTRENFCDGHGWCWVEPVDCDDRNDCTWDGCADGACTHQPDPGGLCRDDDPCTERERCDGAVCTGPRKDCSDGNPCTTDTCNPATGACDHEPVGECYDCKDAGKREGDACEDGDPCTGPDRCNAWGWCQGAPLDPPPESCLATRVRIWPRFLDFGAARDRMDLKIVNIGARPLQWVGTFTYRPGIPGPQVANPTGSLAPGGKAALRLTLPPREGHPPGTHDDTLGLHVSTVPADLRLPTRIVVPGP